MHRCVMFAFYWQIKTKGYQGEGLKKVCELLYCPVAGKGDLTTWGDDNIPNI